MTTTYEVFFEMFASDIPKQNVEMFTLLHNLSKFILKQMNFEKKNCELVLNF